MIISTSVEQSGDNIALSGRGLRFQLALAALGSAARTRMGGWWPAAHADVQQTSLALGR